MILSVFLKFDSAAFGKGIGTAMEAIKGFVRLGGEVSGKFKEAFDLGGQMSDLSALLGESAGDLLVLKQAFEDTGVGGDALGQTLAIMRRNLADLSGSGTKGETFKQMGLDLKALQSMGAEDQLETIGRAIRAMDNPTKQAAASMEIFGRSGAGMLTFLKDDAALGTARASLGSLTDIIDDNANAFDAVSDRIGRLKMKSVGLWAGVAEGLTPLIDQITGMFDGLDVAGFGRRIGETLGAIVELFRQNSLGDILAAGLDAAWTGFKDLAVEGASRIGSLLETALDKMGTTISTMFANILDFFQDNSLGDILSSGLDAALGGFLNTAVKGVLELGNILVTAFERPFAWISAAFQKAIEEMLEKVASIPGVGDALGLAGFKAGSFDSMYQEQLAKRQDASKFMDDFLASWTPFTSSVSEETAKMWEDAVAGFRNRIADIQGAASGAGGAAGEGGGGIGKIVSSFNVPTDRLARIGGIVGGTGGSGKSATDRWIERIEINTRVMADKFTRETGIPTAAWGT
ncbi:MAG: hypothetical protein PHW08_00590 [Kiritimatiellae bacterium]|nr:hypothetical protein [Kiritimatiellia bacterium]